MENYDAQLKLERNSNWHHALITGLHEYTGDQDMFTLRWHALKFLAPYQTLVCNGEHIWT